MGTHLLHLSLRDTIWRFSRLARAVNLSSDSGRSEGTAQCVFHVTSMSGWATFAACTQLAPPFRPKLMYHFSGLRLKVLVLPAVGSAGDTCHTCIQKVMNERVAHNQDIEVLSFLHFCPWSQLQRHVFEYGFQFSRDVCHNYYPLDCACPGCHHVVTTHMWPTH